MDAHAWHATTPVELAEPAVVAATAPAGSIGTTSAKRESVASRKRPASSPRPTKSAKLRVAPSSHDTLRPTAVDNKTTSPHVAVRRTLVLDNGGDTVKYGWAESSGSPPTTSTSNSTPDIRYMPNVTARLPQQWKVLVGDELWTAVSNPNGVAVTRSTERGVVCHLGNQIQVWKRILDALHVSIPKSESSATFGWEMDKKRVTNATGIPSHHCAVMIAVAPYTPRTILDQVLTIWLEDFGFAAVGLCTSSAAAAVERPLLGTSMAASVPLACVVDLGWSAIHVVPVYQDKVIGADNGTGTTTQTTIRRIPLGARHLINIWKYTTSYRQWNLMDNEWTLRDIWEQTARLSTDFGHDMALAQSIPMGRRPWDCEYVLPDYTTRSKGQVRIPTAVQDEIARQERLEQSGLDEDNVESDDEDDDYSENDAQNDARDGDNELEDKEGAVEVDSSSSDNEESPAELRKRVLRERELERRRRDQEAQEQQVLNISVERFAIPEALFRPSDVGLPTDWANVPQAIVQAITACPVVYRAGLYQSIQLVGGVARLPNLVHRLEQELRPLVPAQYTVHVSMSDTATEPVVDLAWKGAARIATNIEGSKWSVSRFDWEQCSKRGAWKRLLQSNGGYLV